MADESNIMIRKLTSADVHATAEVLADAFADNPAYGWMHPRATTRTSDLCAFFQRNLRWHLPLDLTWVATRGPQIVGTSTLEPPGGVPSGVREAVAHWLVPTVRDQGLRTFLRTAAASREFGERYRTLIKGTQYYHVHAVAVSPGFQGNGAQRGPPDGRALGKPRLSDVVHASRTLTPGSGAIILAAATMHSGPK